MISVIKSHDDNLHASCKNGELNDVIKYLNLGADINSVGIDHGTTALLLAATCGNLTIVEYLVNEGADLNIIDKVSISLNILSLLFY
jgi:ankyrin repeat protein